MLCGLNVRMIRKHPATHEPQGCSSKPTVETLRLQAGSASPCMLPGTQQALPCQHRLEFESFELQSHTTTSPPIPAASSQGCHQDAAVTSPGCLLPFSAPQFQAQRLPTHTSTLTVNAFHPQLRELLCPCLQQSHCHSDTVTRTLARLPAQHPPQDRQAHCNASCL